MSARRYQVENHARWLGYVVKERGKRRVAVFFRRSEAREYANWRNAREATNSHASDGETT